MPSIQVVWGLLRLLDDADPLYLGFVCFFLHKNHFLRWFQDRGRLSGPAFFPVCSRYPWGMLHVQGSWGKSSTAFLDLWFWCYVSFLRPQFLLVVVLLQKDFSLQLLAWEIQQDWEWSTTIKSAEQTVHFNKPQRLSVMDCDSFLLEMFKAYTAVGARDSSNNDVCVCVSVIFGWMKLVWIMW